MRGDLEQLTSLLKPYFTPTSFMEVGSRDGNDARYICEYWNINPSKAYIVEANVFCFQNIKSSMYENGNIPFANLIYGACSNKNEIIDFNCVLSNNEELVGISSIKKSLNIKLDEPQLGQVEPSFFSSSLTYFFNILIIPFFQVPITSPSNFKESIIFITDGK
jgi:hypothetical protein